METTSHNEVDICFDDHVSFPMWAYECLHNNLEVVTERGHSVAVLTFSKYQKILQEFDYSDYSIMHVWKRHGKEVPFKTLRDIWYQEMKRLAMENHREKFNKQIVAKYYKEYTELREQGETFCIKQVSDKYGVSSSLMAKYILQNYLSDLYEGTMKACSVKVCFTDLLACPDTHLSYDIWRAQLGDMMFGVRAHRNKRSRGYSYEYQIEEYLKREGIEYSNEEELSAEGDVKKTPDFLLTPCILKLSGSSPAPAYIHWIESKGLFGDPDTHLTLCKKQYSEYVHHYGPGLIIYWTGYVTELKLSFLHNVYVTNYMPQLLPYDYTVPSDTAAPATVQQHSSPHTSTTSLPTSTTPMYTSQTQPHTSILPLHTSTTAMHTSQTQPHTSIIQLHANQTQPHTSITPLHTSTSPPTSTTPPLTGTTLLHTSTTPLHTNTTPMHTSTIHPHISITPICTSTEIPCTTAAYNSNSGLYNYIYSNISSHIAAVSIPPSQYRDKCLDKMPRSVDVDNIFKLAIRAGKNYNISCQSEHIV